MYAMFMVCCTRAGVFKGAARACSGGFESTALLEMTDKRTDKESNSPDRVKKKSNSLSVELQLLHLPASRQGQRSVEQAAARQADQAVGPYTRATGEAAEDASPDLNSSDAAGVDHSADAGSPALNGDYPTVDQFTSQLFAV
jgi:hypothetical protein